MPSRSKRIILDNKETMEKVNAETLKWYKKYLIDIELKGLSPASIKNYSSDLRQWFCFVYNFQDNVCVIALDDDDISEFIYYCKSQGNNTQRLKRRMSSISAFYNYLVKKRVVDVNPMIYLDRPKSKDEAIVQQTFLTKEQVDLMRQRLKENGDIALETYALLSLSTMGRVNAIAHLRWEQCNFEGRTFDDVLEKEQKRVTLYFSEEVKGLLQELQQYREDNNIDDGGWVFCNQNQQPLSTSTLEKWCKRIGEMIDVPSLHCHDLRHSGSQLLSLAGMPLEDVSALLNHSGTDVTVKHYLRADKKKIQDSKDKYDF